MSLRPLVASRRRRSVLAAATTTAVGLMAWAAVGVADNPSGCDFAATGTTQSCSGPLTGSTFAGGDGNLLTSPTTFGSTDWQNVSGLHAGFDQPSGTGDNSFGQGTKEDNAAVSVVSGSIPPNKSDLTRFYEASSIGSNNHNFLYLAWERSNVLGSANMDFEINQQTQPDLTTTGAKTLNRTAGDLLVTYDFTNGGGKPTLGLLFWVTSGSTSQCFSSNSLPCWGNHVTLNGSDSIGAVNNLDAVTDPLFPGSPNYINPVPALQFGETAIDLTAAGVFPPGTCEAFGSAFLKSRASASFGAEVKDFIAPTPVNISNCGSIKIIKHTDPRGQDQVFSYTSNLPAEPAGTVGGVAQGGVKCPGNSSAGVQADGSFCLNDAGNSTGDNAANTVFNNALQGGTYTVTEGADPSGFTFESLSCTGNTTTTTIGKNAIIGLAPGDAVVCTYVNQQNTATLGTQVSNAGPVFPGTAVHDTATVTGNQAGDTPSGTVTFFRCGKDVVPCSSGGNNIGTGTLSGSGATASADSPGVNTSASALAPGTYCFRAEWPGDANYPGALTEFGGVNGTNECFTVQTISTTTHTTPSVGPGGTTFGSSVTDHALVTAAQSGDGYPSGSVTFFICNPSQLDNNGTCSSGGTQVGSPVDTVASNPQTNPPSSTADSAATTVNQTGKWCWRGVYTPGGVNGSNYTGSSDATSGECFTVTDTTGSASAQTWRPNDSATVTGDGRSTAERDALGPAIHGRQLRCHLGLRGRRAVVPEDADERHVYGRSDADHEQQLVHGHHYRQHVVEGRLPQHGPERGRLHPLRGDQPDHHQLTRTTLGQRREPNPKEGTGPTGPLPLSSRDPTRIAGGIARHAAWGGRLADRWPWLAGGAGRATHARAATTHHRVADSRAAQRTMSLAGHRAPRATRRGAILGA